MGHQGICVKDPWTKPKSGRIEGGRWGWVGWGRVGGEMETTILEQHLQIKKEKVSKETYQTIQKKNMLLKNRHIY